VSAGRERRVQAIAVATDGRRASGDMTFAWSVDSESVAILGTGARPLVRAHQDARTGLRATIAVVATQGETRPDSAVDLAAGVPEPELVDDSGGRWRSRFDGRRWQVNASHDDYIALRGEPRTRLRYLLALFAKEVAYRAHGVPGSEDALESLVEILAHAERNLAG
jgi:hypothetical protein